MQFKKKKKRENNVWKNWKSTENIQLLYYIELIKIIYWERIYDDYWKYMLIHFLSFLLLWHSSDILLLFSPEVMSNSLWPRELQHVRLLHPTLSPGVSSNSHPLSQRCYLIITSSPIPSSLHRQSFSASGSFPMSRLYASGGKVLEFQPQQLSFQWILRTNFLQDWLLCSHCSPRLLTVFSSITVWKHQFFSTQPFLIDQFSHPYMTTGIILTNGLLSTKWCLCFLICCLGV